MVMNNLDRIVAFSVLLLAITVFFHFYTDDVDDALRAAGKDIRADKCVMMQKEGDEVIYAYCNKIPETP